MHGLKMMERDRGWTGGLLGLSLGVRRDSRGAARQPAQRPYLPIIVECCCTAASSSLSKMVHSPIAVHPEAADKEWAAPGTFLLLAPPGAARPRWERIAPRLKKQTIKKKIHQPPLPFIVLKREKWGKKFKRTPTDGAAGAVQRAGTTSGNASGGSGFEPTVTGRGAGLGGSVQLLQLSRPAERSLGATPPLRGWGPGKGPGTSPAPGTSVGTERSRAATCEAGAERRAGCGAGNPRRRL